MRTRALQSVHSNEQPWTTNGYYSNLNGESGEQGLLTPPQPVPLPEARIDEEVEVIIVDP